MQMRQAPLLTIVAGIVLLYPVAAQAQLRQKAATSLKLLRDIYLNPGAAEQKLRDDLRKARNSTTLRMITISPQSQAGLIIPSQGRTLAANPRGRRASISSASIRMAERSYVPIPATKPARQ